MDGVRSGLRSAKVGQDRSARCFVVDDIEAAIPEKQVSWPATADNFLLEATTDLAPPANWNPVTNPVTNTNGQLSVILPALGARQFHRLKLLQ